MKFYIRLTLSILIFVSDEQYWHQYNCCKVSLSLWNYLTLRCLTNKREIHCTVDIIPFIYGRYKMYTVFVPWIVWLVSVPVRIWYCLYNDMIKKLLHLNKIINIFNTVYFLLMSLFQKYTLFLFHFPLLPY